MSSFINEVKFVVADRVQMFSRRNLILARFKKHIRVPQIMVSATVEEKVTLTRTMAKIWVSLVIGRSFNWLDYFAKFLKSFQEVQQLLVFVQLKDLELQTMRTSVEDISRLREKLSRPKKDKDRLVVGNKV